MANWTVKDVELKGKVLARVGFQRSVKDGVITNDNRITAALPTSSTFLNKVDVQSLLSPLTCKRRSR